MKSLIKTPLLLLLFLLGSGLRVNGAESTPAEESANESSPQPTLEARCALPFGDNAIFQQNMPIPVWGWSLPGAEVTVTFDRQKKSTVAGNDGAWRMTLDPLPADKLSSVNEAPAGKDLTILSKLGGKEAGKSFSNILIGEVWLCSGQSNMAGRFGRVPYPPGSLAEANFPALRNLEEQWTISTPETAGRFSRVAFCFARKLQAELMVPVGLMTSATGGSPIESWLSSPWHETEQATAAEKAKPRLAANYETKIAPIVGYAMRGAIWYQGEGNEKDGRHYFPKMQALIGGWRKVWAQGDFPFYFVQIASIGKSPEDQPAGGDGRAEIRNAQLQALTSGHTGMAVTIDIGAVHEHPLNKYDVGLRLARWALHNDYGRKDLIPSGPLYKSQKIEGATIRVSFDHAQNGLMLAKKEEYLPPVPTPGAAMPWLSIQSKDGSWHWANGEIDGSDLIVSNKDVLEPVAVRYGYTQYPVGCNLYNKDGLPASPFTTCGY
jgi:sialate O-acetylesterase